MTADPPNAPGRRLRRATPSPAPPLPSCTPENPRTRPGDEVDAATIETPPTEPPLCRTTAAGRPVFDDGPPLT